jgi:hypothetical protein
MELINLKDIKSLYQSAKASGAKADADAYIEAVNDYLQNNPYGYASNIEYIISSSYGIKTFKEFFDTYGIPLMSYDRIIESVDESIKKCSFRNINSDIYKETKTLLESFRNKYQNAFIMFESYDYDSNVSGDEYLKLYYKEQFKLNVPKVLSRFGETAIPDVIIEADKNNKVETTFKFLAESVASSEPATYFQWLSEVAADIKNPSDGVKQLKKKFTKESLEGIVESIKLRNVILHNESVLMDEHRNLEYTESEIQTMKDYISFKEYYMASIDDESRIQSIQNKIISVYEEFDGLIPEDESCADIVEMLPRTTIDNRVLSKQFYPGLNATQINEATANKKSGNAPDYLKNHHDLSYGETDDIKKIEPDVDNTSAGKATDDDLAQSDFLRKSESTPKKSDNKSDNDNNKSSDSQHNNTPINNYYYSYNNSFNKHHTSHNSSDDHSTHTNTDRHDALEYNSDSKNDHASMTESVENDMYILEANELLGLLIENAGISVSNSAYSNTSANSNLLEKFKDVIHKILEFLENLYNNIFPKRFSDFKKLNEKFNRSTAVKKYCDANNGVIKLADIEIDNIDILEQLVKDARDFINNKRIRINTSYGMYKKKERVIVYYTATDQTSTNYGFRIVTSNRCAKTSEMTNILHGNKIDTIKLAALPLMEESIFDSLTSQDVSIIPYREFNDILKKMKHLIVGFDKYENAKECRASFKNLLTELTALSKNIHTVMTISYTTAVNKLKSIEADPQFNKNNINVKKESVDMFTLDIFNESSNTDISDGEEPVDPDKPISDHPVRDTLMDIDRKMIKHQQAMKKTVQDVANVGKTFVKPAQRTVGWINSMVNQWKDTNETKIKEKMADPRSRKGLYNSIKQAIVTGSLFKAGLLLNPIFLFLSVTKKVSDNKNSFRIRNEMIGELKAELSIIDEKIKDAENNRDNAAKYKLIRIKNEIQKKLLRVDGGKKVAKII